MLVNEFSPADLERFSQQAVADPAALVAVVIRLREIANLEGHSFGAVRLASEALRALGAQVPLCRSEQLRLERENNNERRRLRNGDVPPEWCSDKYNPASHV